MTGTPQIVGADDLVLITGASGFIGARLVERLVARGLRNLRCFARPSSNTSRLEAAVAAVRKEHGARVELMAGTCCPETTAREPCETSRSSITSRPPGARRASRRLHELRRHHAQSARGVRPVVVAAAVRQRQLLLGLLGSGTTQRPAARRVVTDRYAGRRANDAYAFAKVKQDEIVREYGADKPFPSSSCGRGTSTARATKDHGARRSRHARHLHAMADQPDPVHVHRQLRRRDRARRPGPRYRRRVFNIVDDDLPTSRKFLWLYKRNVKRFPSIYVPLR